MTASTPTTISSSTTLPGITNSRRRFTWQPRAGTCMNATSRPLEARFGRKPGRILPIVLRAGSVAPLPNTPSSTSAEGSLVSRLPVVSHRFSERQERPAHKLRDSLLGEHHHVVSLDWHDRAATSGSSLRARLGSPCLRQRPPLFPVHGSQRPDLSLLTTAFTSHSPVSPCRSHIMARTHGAHHRHEARSI